MNAPLERFAVERSAWVVGIDLSLTGCAVTAAKLSLPAYQRTLKSKPSVGVLGRVARYRSIVVPIFELCVAWKPALVLIEGYAFEGGRRRGEDGAWSGSSQRGHHDRAELRGVLLDRIADYCGAILEPSPNALKKFAADHGHASKDEVKLALEKRYGRKFKDDNESDSWALAMLGLVLTEQAEPESEAQAEVVYALRSAMSEVA